MAYQVSSRSQDDAAKQIQMTNLLLKGFATDCLLHVQNQGIRCHKIVLSAASPFFLRMFSADAGNGEKYEMTGMSISELRSMVFYIYAGKVQIEFGVQRFLELCQLIEIPIDIGIKPADPESKDIPTVEIAAITPPPDTTLDTTVAETIICTPSPQQVVALITELASYVKPNVVSPRHQVVASPRRSARKPTIPKTPVKAIKKRRNRPI